MKRLALCALFLLHGLLNAQSLDSLMAEANGYFQVGKYKLAIEMYTKALDKAKVDFGEESNESADALQALGMVYSEVGKYQKSESSYLLSLGIKKKLLGTNNTSYALTLGNLGTINVYMGDYADAEKYLLESMEIKGKLNGERTDDYSVSLNNLAYLYQMMNRFEDSERLYFKSLAIREQLYTKSSRQYASVLNNLGYLYMEMSRYSESEKYYLEALEIRKQLVGSNHSEYAETVINLGALYDKLGMYDQAITLYEKAKLVTENRLGKDHPDYALILNNLAFTKMHLEQFDDAEKYYLESLDLLKLTNGDRSPYYAIGLGNLASVYSKNNKIQDAIALYNQALTLIADAVGKQQKVYTDNLVSLGVLYHRLKKYEQADSQYRQALVINEAIYGGDNIQVAELKYSMAGLSWNKGDMPQAKIYFTEAIKILSMEIERQSAYLSESEMEKYLYNNKPIIESFYSFCSLYGSKDPSLIVDMMDFNSLMNGKLLNNSSLLKVQVTESKDSSLEKKYDQWLGLKMSINKEMLRPLKMRNKYMEDWQLQAGQLEKELTRSINIMPTDNSMGAWHKAKSNLKSDEAIIEFISFEMTNGIAFSDSIQYSAIVLRPYDSLPIYVPLFKENNLKGLFKGDTLRTFANLLYTDAQVRTVEHDISYGDSLYSLVWKPIEIYLKDVKHIYYNPSGILHNVAHDAIPVDDEHLISDLYQLERITSTRSLLEASDPKINLNSVELLGGIQYELDTTLMNGKSKWGGDFFLSASRSLGERDDRGGAWSYLPGAKKEVEGIADIFKKNHLKASLYVENDAREEIVKGFNATNSPSIIHFSTHGFFFPDPIENDQNGFNADVNPFTVSNNPLYRSGLLMYGANYVWKGNQPFDGIDDGILTAYEVSNLYLPNTRLVVMSACETGLGDIKGSEGVYGLQRAFKMAGVEYLIVTLWQVLDKETSDFMILFYQNLLEKRSIPDAFKVTQDVMKNKYRDEPYKWAGFVLIR